MAEISNLFTPKQELEARALDVLKLFKLVVGEAKEKSIAEVQFKEHQTLYQLPFQFIIQL